MEKTLIERLQDDFEYNCVSPGQQVSVAAEGLLDTAALEKEAIAELSRLSAELESARAVIAQHDLCHNLHGKVDALAFAEGCAAEQRKLYGCAPDVDRAESAERELESVRVLARWHSLLCVYGDTPEAIAEELLDAKRYALARTLMRDGTLGDVELNTPEDFDAAIDAMLADKPL